MNFIKYNIKIQRLFIITLGEKLFEASRNRGVSTAQAREILVIARGSLCLLNFLKSHVAACLHAIWRSKITRFA